MSLFAGIGGWCLAANELGFDPLGIEWDEYACKTREAAGLRTLRADVTTLDPMDFGPCALFTASPPCQDFSSAGKRAGIEGDRGKLVYEPLRWIRALRPQIVAMEQVPPVLPIWRQYVEWLIEMGYSAWCGVLNAADFGVAQTRERAIFMATLSGTVDAPMPTHAEGGEPSTMFGAPERKPWVSMAEALGWGYAERGSPTVTGGGYPTADPSRSETVRDENCASGWTVKTRGKLERGDGPSAGGTRFDASRPSWSLTHATYAWKRNAND